ncbi:MAG: adenine deaminase [Dehalococcoidia bacterium]|nr:MAG: adenine deaminase [Dehalococcoidia bacterium]
MKRTLELIEVARGLKPADLILSNARIVNVFNGEIEKGNVAIYGSQIAGIGDYHLAREIIDIKGQYLVPGLINGHTHVESSMLDIGQYASAVIPHGTLGVVTDLHEIANVSGIKGIDYILSASRHLPFEFFVMAPSCVPATHLETSGAGIDGKALRHLLRRKEVIGLGEMMNYSGVLSGDTNVLDKIEASRGKPADGHAPGLSGRDLNAYIASGISSDHECVTLEEACEKLARGMYVMIREGSSEKNLEALLPMVTDLTYKRCLFVVDDRSCTDLLRDGDIDAVVRKAIRLGLEPVRAIQLATINTAERFGLKRIGAVAPGYLSNLIVTTDLNRLDARLVFHRGRLVAHDGQFLYKPKANSKRNLENTVMVKPFGPEALRFTSPGEAFPVIEVIPGQIITRKLKLKVRRDQNGFIISDVERDALKLVVVERHKASGNIGRGLVKGFGLKRGALASSVAHDSHNIVAVGTNDIDILTAIREVIAMQGGLAVTGDGRILASLPLSVSGLMSDRPLAEVVKNFACLEEAAKELGCGLAAPFDALSFLALPVIPQLRLTDMGLVDVNAFKIIQT